METGILDKRKVKKFNGQTYLRWYEMMLRMRFFEERAGQLYLRQKIRGFCHLYIGQEALLAGVLSAIRKDDNVITAYRDHAHALSCGTDAKNVMAELFGKSTGCSKGKGGSMHMYDVSRRYFGGHAIVGAQIPLAAGIAFAEKYKGTSRLTLCYMGDGAVRQGAFHETLNMAMMWKLPVIFIIENNRYAMGTSVARSSNVAELYHLGRAYEMPSFQVDGMKCEEVHLAVESVSHGVRSGEGPVLLEMLTYRYRGHSMSDPASYRTREELESFKSHDCIDHVLSVIRKEKHADEKEIAGIQERVKGEIDEAEKFAEESPFPDARELYEDVYAQKDYPFIKD